MLWVDGQTSSYFLLVMTSSPTRCTYEKRETRHWPSGTGALGPSRGTAKNQTKLPICLKRRIPTDANDKPYLGVSVLASLGCRHLAYPARASLQHDHAVLPQRRALHRVRFRGPGSTFVKMAVGLWLKVHRQQQKKKIKGSI